MLRDPYRLASLIVVVGGIGMLIAGSIFAFSFVQGPRYTIDVYQIDQSVVENGITLAVRRVFYRAGYRTGYQLVRDKKREEVLVEGYIGNSTDKPVRFFVFEQIGSGPRNGLVTFRWDRGVRDKIIDTPFVRGSLRPRLSEQGEAIGSPANRERLLVTAYETDDTGDTYWEIPAGEKRQLTVKGSRLRLPRGWASGVLRIGRDQFADTPDSWSYELVLPLGEPVVEEYTPTQEHVQHPAFGGGDPQLQC